MLVISFGLSAYSTRIDFKTYFESCNIILKMYMHFAYTTQDPVLIDHLRTSKFEALIFAMNTYKKLQSASKPHSSLLELWNKLHATISDELITPNLNSISPDQIYLPPTDKDQQETSLYFSLIEFYSDHLRPKTLVAPKGHLLN
ncbi:MAG: hypothetical protein OXE99_04965 [Cellvibrionales bacterium]|nr:hypothetical protein [Cellvibrionales bacterium]